MAAPEHPRGTARDASDATGPAARWASIRAAAEVVLSLPPEARPTYLDGACAGDTALRADVEAQVDACERAAQSSFLGGVAADFGAPLLSPRAMAGAGGARESERRAAAEGMLREALAGRYDIEREIGRGGMATVYLAQDRRHDRRVALKVLDPALGAAMSAERFLREIRLTASLTHPHILPLYDSGESDGQLFYVMPYIAGETLRARLSKGGALPIAEATRLVRELADALAHAHARGVIHRDLKPANVLLADGHAVVADFGIARAVGRARETSAPGATQLTFADTLTEAGVALGTRAYMAPEQAIGHAAVDHRADLYALGVIAFELLAGRHPFANRAWHDMLAAQLTEPPPSLDVRRTGAPPALAALVTRLLAKDPAARPQTAAAVVQELDDIATVSTPSGSLRRRRIEMSAATVLAFAVGVGAYVALRRTPMVSRGAAEASAVPAVAVLPFVNTGPDLQDDYFSDGLTDELTDALVHVPGLRLAGRSSSYAFKGKSVPVTEIGKALGVGQIIEGTVRRAGDRLRVTAQLVSVADGTVLWDSVYESRSRDVFAVQDSLTHAVVAALAPTLGALGTVPVERGGSTGFLNVKRGTADEEAYELYLKGRYYWHERGAANIARSIDLFQRAIARDPTFARAYAALAFAYDVLGIYVPDASDSAKPLLDASARRAVTLDSTLADAQVAEALARWHDFQFGAAESHFRAAIAAEPSNEFAHHSLGTILASVGRTDDAIAELRLATRLDPLAKSAGTALSEALIDARRFNEAETEARRVLAIDSTFSLALNSLGLALAFDGRADSAARTIERSVRLQPNAQGAYGRLVFAYAAAGRWADAERVRARLHQSGNDLSGGVEAAFADLVLGDREPLVRLLATRAGQSQWMDTFFGIGCRPLLDPLWSDTRFRAAMRDLGVPRCTRARPWLLPPR